MGKISVDLSDDLEDDGAASPEAAKLHTLAAGLPSVHKAKMEGLRHVERVQLAFSNIPKPIKDSYEAEARKRGMSMKEFLYHCLRAGGLNIPSNAELDGRRR